jgi:cytidylate kinase
MQNRIITISRQFGSGGRTIGKNVAAKLGIPCYDQELIEKIAAESGFAKEYIDEKSEDAPGGSWLQRAIRSQQEFITQDYLWKIQQQVILDLAKQGSCVFVGRCADYILQTELGDRANCLTVFIHADLKKRAERIVRIYGETNDAPVKRLQDKDKRRAAYYNIHTNQVWGAAENYQIALDSGALGIEKCTDLIFSLY